MQIYSLALTSLLIASSSALAPASSSSRRQWLQTIGGAAATLVANPNLANAGLLDDFGADPTNLNQAPAAAVAVPIKDASAVIEPNLRSNYYYPTNKKRYLPRIKKCNDALASAAESIGNQDWPAVSEFADKIADDTILPLKLYTSSLSGGGTNVKVSYTKTMSTDASLFEKNQKALVKAIAKQDQAKASTALEGMASALQDYRVVASLTGPDGGGDIPSVDEIRRAACRVQGRRFEQKINARDQRVQGPATEGVAASSTSIASK